ncbi:MAG: hypothetical protein HYR85_01110 [Planctomycetes bacterium]|nr:hypothetical protein [Planctomycetota bacterium]MBI3847016.1 hypothetical protein [Planctomycetota bacterium]
MKTYLLFVGFFCLLTVGLVTVWHQVDTLRVGYDVSRLSRRVEDLNRDCNRLTVSITGLKSPPKIDELAHREGLDLVRPHRVSSIAVHGVSGDMQTRCVLGGGLESVASATRTRSASAKASRVASTVVVNDARNNRNVQSAGPGSGRHRDTGRTLGWVSSRGLTGRP